MYWSLHFFLLNDYDHCLLSDFCVTPKAILCYIVANLNIKIYTLEPDSLTIKTTQIYLTLSSSIIDVQALCCY